MFSTSPFISENSGKNVSAGKGRSFFMKRKYMLNKETIILVDNIIFALYTTLEKHANLQRDTICLEKKTLVA